MTIVIDAAKALELLELAVAERGADYVYPHEYCEYAINGEPACIVGVALSKAGVPIDTLSDICGSVKTIADDAAWYRDHPNGSMDYGFIIEADAVKAWQAAQFVQDGAESDGSADRAARGTWGDALAAAKAALS